MGRKKRDDLKGVLPVERVQPLRGKRKRSKFYILTSAQNNTNIHPSFHSLKAYAEHLDAELYVSTFLYAKRTGYQRNLDKSQERNNAGRDAGIWYDEAIVPYINNERVEIAKGLVWCGEGNTLPTAANPLSSMQVYTGRNSMIYPHTKQEVEPIATVTRGKAKLNYTTGTCTLRNYIERKAGLLAEFYHTYGAVIVETDDSGHWYVRQLQSDNEGVIYDWDLKITPDGKITNYIEAGERPLALVCGDVHVANVDEDVRAATWDDGGLVDQLQPQHQFIHDVFDGYARSHHAMKHPYKMLVRYYEKKDSVEDEVRGVREFLTAISRDYTKTIVVNSNHDRHLMRWLEENDGRWDPVNAAYWSSLNNLVTQNIKHNGFIPDALALAVDVDGEFEDKNNCIFLGVGAGYVLGGIEFGMHGDVGKGGSRGSLAQFARMGRRSVTGHDHVGGLKGGAAKAGTNSRYDLEYNIDGMSSWTQTDVLVYPNGKLTLLTFYAGKFRA